MISRKALLSAVALTGTALLSACAVHPEKPLARSDLSRISGVEVLKPAARPIEVKTLSGGILMTLGGLVTGPLGAYQDESATQQARRRARFPDFGELLARNLAQRAPKELTAWPKTELVASASPTPGAAVLSFEIVNPFLTVIRGFTVEVTGTLKDAGGKVLWSKYFWYRSYDFGRSGEQQDYLKDNYALLKREIELAARDTATVMLRDLKQGL